MSKLILIVEDDVDQRDILSELLELSGYRVNTASTGQQALELIVRESPALILMDLGLKDMNGRQLLRRIRALSSQPPPIVFTTGSHPSQTQDISSEVLLKPFDIDTLMNVVGRHCGNPSPTIFDSPSQSP